MLRTTASACIEAPAHVVWEHLAQLDKLHLWIDLVHHSYISSACATGVGAERTCNLGGSRTLHERVVAWDEGRSFTYESSDAPLMRLARNTWSVTPVGEKCLVTSEAELELRGGWFANALGWMLLPLIRLLLPNPLAKLKFWVENGRPYEGRARSLPVPLAAC